jgi:hypothetical protein
VGGFHEYLSMDIVVDWNNGVLLTLAWLMLSRVWDKGHEWSWKYSPCTLCSGLTSLVFCVLVFCVLPKLCHCQIPSRQQVMGMPRPVTNGP